MRVLLAVDGSASANLAVAAVASTHWPRGSSVRVVSVLAHPPSMRVADPDRGERPVVDESDPAARRQIAVDDAVRELGGSGRHVDSVLLLGRPASAIVDEARDMAADLIVVGSRGHGPWESIILGSVSAEVVDHAPCPVLVVRGERLQPVILAVDGSAGARRAEDLLTRWPLPRAASVTVVTAVQTGASIAGAASMGIYDPMTEAHADALVSARAEARAIVEDTARRLRVAGIDATAEAVEGDVAETIVAVARQRRAGLIVVGSRGHGGLTRLLLGSVARNVLFHAPCSVLVVRPEAVRRTADKPVEAPGEVVAPV